MAWPYIYINLLCYLKAVNGTSPSFRIPEKPPLPIECPSNTYGCSGDSCNRPQSCFCEEHCSWEICRLVEYPEMCLKDVNSFWNWDATKLGWVAQIEGMS